jgi:RNA polymerase sigma factor (sigma-70 family)
LCIFELTMNDAALFEQLRKRNFSASKVFFERYYGRMLAVCRRYCAEENEALSTLFDVFDVTIEFLLANIQESKENLWPHLELALIKKLIEYNKQKGAQFHVSNTVHPKSQNEFNFDLFAQNTKADYSQLTRELLIQAIQQLAPAHRIVYNLCVIDNFSIQEVAEFMDYSTDTVRGNLDKAKFLLRKNLDHIFSKPAS